MNNLGPVFWQNTLPLMITILVAGGGACFAGWISNANMNKRLDDIVQRLGRIEDRLLLIETRLTAVERKVDALELKAWR